jgi:uncharacterized membrane protein YkvA (DUF1232 family)
MTAANAKTLRRNPPRGRASSTLVVHIAAVPYSHWRFPMKSPVVRKTRGKLDISMISKLRNLPAFLADGDVPFLKKGVLLAALVYVISPVDFIPDIPIIGWLDDMGVMGAVYMYLMGQLGDYVGKKSGVQSLESRVV